MTEKKENMIEKFAAEIDDALWDTLAPHHKRKSLFMLDRSLELPAVGVSMFRDEVIYIQKWLSDKKLYQPTDEQIEVWTEENTKFKYLIIQPYVLVKLETEELI